MNKDCGHSALDEAEQFLQGILSAGTELSKYILEAAEAEGISIPTLRRAKKALGITSRRLGNDENAVWCWVLPPKMLNRRA